MRFLPVFFPPERCLGHAAVHAQPVPVDAFEVVVGHQARLPHGEEDSRLDPVLEAVVGGRAGAIASGIERFPLAASAQHEKDRFHTDAIRRARTAAAEAMGVFMFGQEEGHGLPQFIRDTPGFGDGTVVHDKLTHKDPAAVHPQLHSDFIARRWLIG